MLRQLLTLAVRALEKYSRGRRGAPAKGVGRLHGAGVQIPPSPSTLRFIREDGPFSFSWDLLLCMYHDPCPGRELVLRSVEGKSQGEFAGLRISICRFSHMGNFDKDCRGSCFYYYYNRKKHIMMCISIKVNYTMMCFV